MRTISTRPRRGLTGLIALGSVAVLLTGCSRDEGTTGNTDDAAGVTASAIETARVTATQPHDESPTAGNDAVENTPAPGQGAPVASCANTPADNPLTGEEPIPIRFANSDATDGRFYYAPAEGGVDSCIPLSWVRLAGTTGQEGSGPGSTTGSFTETIALFGDGHLITDPAPILARRLDSVEQIDERTIRVNYAFHNDQPAVLNETTPGSATFHWDGSKVTVSNNTIPPELNETAVTLDLSGVE